MLKNNMIIRIRKPLSHDATDYALKSTFFVTICVENHACILGKIVDNRMVLSDHGKMVERTFNTIENTKPGLMQQYIIMPNHIHIIVDTDSISTIVRDFKSFTTRQFNIDCGTKCISFWQRGYYDHRIRNEEEMNRIGEYIENNPKSWFTDKFFGG